MLLDIIVGILFALIGLELMKRRVQIEPEYRSIQSRKIELEIHKPQDNVYLVYVEGDFILQATSIEECANKICDKFGAVSMGFVNKDKEVPEQEWKILFDTIINKLNSK